MDYVRHVVISGTRLHPAHHRAVAQHKRTVFQEGSLIEQQLDSQ